MHARNTHKINQTHRHYALSCDNKTLGGRNHVAIRKTLSLLAFKSHWNGKLRLIIVKWLKTDPVIVLLRIRSASHQQWVVNNNKCGQLYYISDCVFSVALKTHWVLACVTIYYLRHYQATRTNSIVCTCRICLFVRSQCLVRLFAVNAHSLVHTAQNQTNTYVPEIVCVRRTLVKTHYHTS